MIVSQSLYLLLNVSPLGRGSVIFLNQRDPWRQKRALTWRFWRWEGQVPVPARRAGPVIEQKEEPRNLHSDAYILGDHDK